MADIAKKHTDRLKELKQTVEQAQESAVVSISVSDAPPFRRARVIFAIMANALPSSSVSSTEIFSYIAIVFFLYDYRTLGL